MLKKKLSILSLILLLVLSLGLCSTTYATTLTKSEAFEICKDNCGYATLFNSPANNESANYISYANFLTYLDNRSEQYYYVYMDNSLYNQKYFNILYFDNITNVYDYGFTFITNEVKQGSKKEFQNYWNWYALRGNTVNKYTEGYTFNFPTGNNSFYMLYGNGEILASSFDVPDSFSFIPENIYQTSGTPQLNVNKFDYKSKRVKLGELESADYYLIDVKLKDENGIIIGSDGTLSNQLSNTSIEWESNALYRNRLNYYANTIYLNYERPYLLSIDVYEDRNTVHNYEYYYIFYPPNAIIESGAVVSAGSGDFNIQDNTLAITESINNLTENLLNTNIGSGEEPTLNNLTVPEVEDVTEDFFTWLMNSILDILYNNNDSTLEIPLYNTTHYIRSDIYKLNIEPLKTFVQAGWWFIVGLPVLKYIRRSIERLKGGELPATDDKSDLLGNIL